MIVGTLTAMVAVGDKRVDFCAFVHKTEEDSQRLLDLDFYREFGEVPIGTHHEIELCTDVWTHRHWAKIHFRKSKTNGVRFVCYPKAIPSIEKVREVFDLWCVGTAFTMATGRDFQEVLNGDKEKFLKVMKETYRVNMAGSFFQKS